MRRLLAALRGDKGKWEFIGDNRDTEGIPSWVIAAFAKVSGSQGTMLIDYPDSGRQLVFRGRRYRYMIDMGNQSWKVYRRLRRRAARH